MFYKQISYLFITHEAAKTYTHKPNKNFSASEVTTLWRYTNLFIIIIIIIKQICIAP